MKKLFLLLSVLGCIGLMTQCEDQDQAEHLDEFLSCWYPTNQGTEPYGDMYRWEQLTPCPSGYRFPTKAEFWQLQGCPSVWGTGPGGVNGRWFCPTRAAKDNPSSANGCVFFPAAGYCFVYSDGRVDTYGQGSGGYYWSSTPYVSYPNHAYGLYFYSNEVGVDRFNWRYTYNDGSTCWLELSVRCIKDA